MVRGAICEVGGQELTVSEVLAESEIQLMSMVRQ